MNTLADFRGTELNAADRKRDEGMAVRTPAMKSTSVDAGSGLPPDVELGPLADYIGFHLRLAQDASFRAFARNIGRKDIKPGHFAALLVIESNPGIGQGELGRAIARDKSTVTPLIQNLRQRGLIEIRRSAKDGRRINLMVTQRGKALLREMQELAREHDRRLDVIVGGEKYAFIAMLRKVANELG